MRFENSIKMYLKIQNGRHFNGVNEKKIQISIFFNNLGLKKQYKQLRSGRSSISFNLVLQGDPLLNILAIDKLHTAEKSLDRV